MLLFDLSHRCNSVCSLCHRFSYGHRPACPCRRARVRSAGTRAAARGRGQPGGTGNPQCHSPNCRDAACGRLGVFCIQNGAGFPVPRQLWARHMAGNASSDLWVPLAASGNIAVAFSYTYWGAVSGSVPVTICLCLLSEWLHCSSHKMLCVHTPFMADDNPLLRCFNSAVKDAF